MIDQFGIGLIFIDQFRPNSKPSRRSTFPKISLFISPESNRTDHDVHGIQAFSCVAVVAGRIDATVLNSVRTDPFDCHTSRRLHSYCCCWHCSDCRRCRLCRSSSSSLNMEYVHVSLLSSPDSLEDPAN